MSTWLLENTIWLIAGVVVLVVAIKMAALRLFRHLAAADAENAAEESD